MDSLQIEQKVLQLWQSTSTVVPFSRVMDVIGPHNLLQFAGPVVKADQVHR